MEQHRSRHARTHSQGNVESIPGPGRMVGHLPASGPARPHYRQARAPGSPRLIGTKEKKAAERLVNQLNEMLADRVYWEPSSRPRALARFHPLVVDIFYHDMVPEPVDASTIREVAIPLPRSTDSDYRQVLLLGTTGGGKTTLGAATAGHRSCRRAVSIDLDGTNDDRRYGDSSHCGTLPGRCYVSSA